ncbi:MAG: DUF951 domain-containing protein [Armatimonadota bacterium]
MRQPLRIEVGDRVRLKKRHPCGGFWWEVLRTGADIRIECLVCGRVVMLPRREVQRRTREVLTPEDALPEDLTSAGRRGA